MTKSVPLPTPTALATLVLKFGEMTKIMPNIQQSEINDATSFDFGNWEKEYNSIIDNTSNNIGLIICRAFQLTGRKVS